MERVPLYIDGYNFYYGATKDELKNGWCNFRTLGRYLAKEAFGDSADVGRVLYYTSIVEDKDQERNPGEIERQKFWLDALECGVRGVEIILGKYQTKYNRTKRKEKLTDVHLATDLLLDGIPTQSRKGRAYNMAILLSGDKDFLPAVLAANEELGRLVRIFLPHRSCEYAVPEGYEVGRIRTIPRAILESSRLEDDIRGPGGRILRWSDYVRMKTESENAKKGKA